MDIILPGHSLRRKKLIDLSMQIAADLGAGMSVADVRKRYKNPKTRKPYTRSHIYSIIRQLRELPAKTY